MSACVRAFVLFFVAFRELHLTTSPVAVLLALLVLTANRRMPASAALVWMAVRAATNPLASVPADSPARAHRNIQGTGARASQSLSVTAWWNVWTAVPAWPRAVVVLTFASEWLVISLYTLAVRRVAVGEELVPLTSQQWKRVAYSSEAQNLILYIYLSRCKVYFYNYVNLILGKHMFVLSNAANEGWRSN